MKQLMAIGPKVGLDYQIDMNLYERKALSDKNNNFKNTLVEP